MRSVIGPIALGLLITATGCVESTGYPTTYGYRPAPTYYAPTYSAARPIYYQPAPVYTPPPRYVAVPVYPTAYAAAPPRPHHRHPRRDRDD